MKRFNCLLLSILVIQSLTFGQATEKARKPSLISFYTQDQFIHDQYIGTVSKTKTVVADVKNPSNKIIENIDNPPGTVVMDANLSLKDMEELINDPEKIIFSKNYAEIPYQSGQTRYRIPVTRSSSAHHSLDDPIVITELTHFRDDCAKIKGQVPELITLSHHFEIDACRFSAFASVTDMFKPYHTWRLNMVCALLKRLRDEFWCYESFRRNTLR